MDESGAMSFVLSDGTSADTAPIPKNMNINLSDVPSESIAYREFSGIATDNEISRQKVVLADALERDGIAFEYESLKVFQFNPPYTLPWLRLNSVTFKLMEEYVPFAPLEDAFDDASRSEPPSDEESDDVGSEEGGEVFYSSPEAGE